MEHALLPYLDVLVLAGPVDESFGVLAVHPNEHDLITLVNEEPVQAIADPGRERLFVTR
jgi:hypothetical protein